jgi:hypothetical protein
MEDQSVDGYDMDRTVLTQDMVRFVGFCDSIDSDCLLCWTTNVSGFQSR